MHSPCAHLPRRPAPLSGHPEQGGLATGRRQVVQCGHPVRQRSRHAVQPAGQSGRHRQPQPGRGLLLPARTELPTTVRDRRNEPEVHLQRFEELDERDRHTSRQQRRVCVPGEEVPRRVHPSDRSALVRERARPGGDQPAARRHTELTEPGDPAEGEAKQCPQADLPIPRKRLSPDRDHHSAEPEVSGQIAAERPALEPALGHHRFRGELSVLPHQRAGQAGEREAHRREAVVQQRSRSAERNDQGERPLEEGVAVPAASKGAHSNEQRERGLAARHARRRRGSERAGGDSAKYDRCVGDEQRHERDG